MNLEQVDSLIEKMERASLTEISYKDKDVDIKLKRDLSPAVTQVPQTVHTQNAPQVPHTPAKEVQPEDEGLVVRAPMVGTFYKAPSPEADAYVKVGDKVSSTSVVCILEAMKLFNEIQADVSGEVTEILVDDGDMVEYNQPLFRLR
ncbi:acetyl-CoA carboxylase biotin carboxyl carrier protein subunit [Jeotgalicoccus coquinae]|uniref:Biotin carboxyl carrier protein of acetyl-CoA carboxylase n=1 Tax=Jeotgalicoccus coquinae TaxID=709509 RepID=A0A6V7R8Q3_9STAP|nr:acetyl-CoA carboxylase biotin carboxyl carrier protein [Jeotgalicoccus coquinae]MBB6422891.1 acetyl-CoA carboxylase biotin carboxyl carrier protein [Jeotgalicoccus coquinae]GGE12315.1 acetyl-CoA carboxylase biotin carboxyl carrier protein subunit [Jeotgalicoccus coquinae]CAD2073741.1 Biotin carboxyl carrier protein of acetyl-CoA carboxylase [Jeotgalicoccus coquinae]